MAAISSLLKQLRTALADRRIRDGYALLDRERRPILRAAHRGDATAEMAMLVALWVDTGHRDPALLEELLIPFPAAERGRLPLQDFLRLRLVDAVRAMLAEDAELAIDLLEFILRARKEVTDPWLLLFAEFIKARAHRKKGEYETAHRHLVEARQMAQKLSLLKLAAVFQIQEGWLAFQRGEGKAALQIFKDAEAQLSQTDDHLAIANIHSARGRIVRRSGEYQQALEHYARAVALFRARDPQHRNLARTLVNAAYVKRLVALQLRKRIDDRAQRGGAQRLAEGDGAFHTRYLRLCQDALDDLQTAGEIYALHHHHGGTGSVLVNAGYLHLDRGNMEQAEAKALKAYDIAGPKHDHILMARARILESTIENLRVEEQLGDENEWSHHANAARKMAEEAVSLAKLTQNRRLLAGAWIALGAAAANDFFQDWEEAKQCAAKASSLLFSQDRDHISEELLTLKGRILRASGVDETLRAWSDGVLGGKTFQQVTEEFAEIVIPKVWLREGKRVSRVAEQLSISPKKVRRILRSTGHLEDAGPGAER